MNGEPVQLIEAAPITLTVEGFNGSGVAACNNYEFTMRFGDGGLELVSGPGHTDMGCSASISHLQDVYLESIGPSANYAVDDTTLTWQTPTATWVFTRVPPVPAAPLVRTTWVLNGVLYEFGGMTVPGIDAARIVFADDGSFHGSTGCRNFTGRWVLTNDAVTTRDVTFGGECTRALTEVDEIVAQVLDEGFAGSIDGDHLAARPRDNLGLDYFVQA